MRPTMYQICIRGRVSDRLGSTLEGMRLKTSASETNLTSEILDQSQLYGLLDRIRHLGLELLSAQPQPAVGPLTKQSDSTLTHH